MRKTVKIDALIVKANYMLAASIDDLKKEREGIASFVESILCDHGVYNGFNLLNKAQLKGKAKIPGVNHCCTCEERLKILVESKQTKDPWFENCDSTRKAFQIKA